MKKVLLIEDDETISDNLCEMLRMNGYEVEIAENGEEGLRKAHYSIPSIIVSDVTMPMMNGYELIQKIRDIPALYNVPFIFITANMERDNLRKGMDLGADDYITKPFKAQELLDSIKMRLEKRAMQENLNGYEHKNISVVKKAIDSLTKTEKKILMLVATGLDNKELAATLFVSRRTVEKHRANILEKMQLGGNNGLLRFVSLHKHLVESLVVK